MSHEDAAKLASAPHIGILASAGSGKTHQLTMRLVRLFFDGASPSEIIAVTFTRKAAGAILKSLFRWLASATLNPRDCAELARFAHRPLDSAAAGRILLRLVDGLHAMEVGTLDSLFVRLAKSCGDEIYLPPDWAIADSQTADQSRSLAIAELLAAENPAQLRDLLRLMSRGTIGSTVMQQFAHLASELYACYLAASDREIWRQLATPAAPDPERVAWAKAVLAEWPTPVKKNGEPNKNWQSGLAALRKQVALGKWKLLVTKGIAGKVFEEDLQYYEKEIPEDLAAPIRVLNQLAAHQLVLEFNRQTLATFELLAAFHKHYGRTLQERGAFGFGELASILAGATARGVLADFHFRLDAHLRHLLLDEFQDTSLTQWTVLAPMAEELTATVSGESSFFFVGDLKQGIFGWRGGDTDLFRHLEESLPNIHWHRLHRSYRSTPVVIEFVNRVFAPALANVVDGQDQAAVSKWLQHFQSHQADKTEPGYVAIEVAPAAPDTSRVAPETLKFAARRIAELAAHAPNTTIGVLVRRNVAVSRLIYELRRLGILASEEGGNPLTDSPAVGLLLSFIRLADQPRDTVAAFHVLTSPLAELLGLKADTAWRDETTRRTLETAARALRADICRLGFAAALDAPVRWLSARASPHEQSRLRQLLGLARRFPNTSNTRPSDFCRFVELERVENPAASRIRVMTIHKAKGLEFDIVVLPELDIECLPPRLRPRLVVRKDPATLRPSGVLRYPSEPYQALSAECRDYFRSWRDEVIREQLCLLYVALTRAAFALHIIVAPNPAKKIEAPKSFADLLRLQLIGKQSLKPETVAFELEGGDKNWYQTSRQRRASMVAAPPPSAPPSRGASSIAFAKSVRARRSLPRVTPSQLARASAPPSFRLLDHTAVARGRVFHRWFETIEWLEPAATIADAIDAPRLLALVAREVDAVTAQALLERFRIYLQQLARDRWFDASRFRAAVAPSSRSDAQRAVRVELLREHPFALRLDSGLCTGAIDRLTLVRAADRVVAAELLDYKTEESTSERAPDAATRLERYGPQLAIYRKAVAQLWRLPPASVRTVLVFLGGGIETLECND
ncbi:MAG: UvrD-helicase domain-containing protein [Planctomycetota bacterium]